MEENLSSGSVPSVHDSDIIQDESFSYAGYQVVRGEFFAHINEPSITFNKCKVYVNTACVNKLWEVDYVQILVNSDEMKLAIRPCREDEKDSFLWRIDQKTGRKKPREITCRLFFAKIVHLMDWNPDYRYKMLGKLIQSNREKLFSFDLAAAEVYQRIPHDSGHLRISRTPTFPAEWQNQFGLPVEDHRRSLQVNIFDGYAVFGLKGPVRPEKPREIQESEGAINE